MRNKISYIFVWLLMSVCCLAQNNTSLTGTVTDSDLQVWANAGWTAQLQIPGGGGTAQFISGGAVPRSNNGFFDINGVILAGETLPNNAQILPTGTTWKICVASVTSAPQQCFVFPVTGASFNFGSKLSSLITAPRIEAAKTNYAYNVVEIINPVQGTGYINSITGTCAVFTGMGYAGCGGGGAPVTTGSIQRNNGGTLGPSLGNIDAAGNSTLKSFGGTNDANFLNETTPHVSNDAISNTLQVNGNVATVNQAYPPTEYHSNGMNIRVPLFLAGSMLFGVPTPNFAYNTTFNDWRANNMGTVIYNPNAAAPSMIHNTLYKDDDEAGSNGQATSYFPYRDTNLFHCCGVPQSANTQSNNIIYTHQLRDLTWGIKGYDNYEYACDGVGDCHLHQHYLAANGGCNNFGDECSTLNRNIIQEDLNPFFGTVPALAKGTKILPVVTGSSSNAPGEGRYIANITQQGTQLHITSVVAPVYPTTAYYHTDTTFTNDTFCGVDHPGSQGPPLTKGATTNTQIFLGNCSAAITTTSKICIASAQGAQHVNVTSAGTMTGGAQIIFADLERPIASAEVIYQGPNACKLIEILADQKAAGTTQPHRTFVRQLGHSFFRSSDTIDFVSVYAGRWNDGPTGNFNQIAMGAGITLTRDGSGNVCTPIGADFAYAQVGVRYRINSAVDPSYNTVATIATETPFTNMCWSNPGAAGSTTTTGASWGVAPNGFDVNAAVIGPGELVMQAENPVTRSADGTVVIEANDTTPAFNDIYASSASEENAIQINHDTVQWAVGAVNPAAAQGMIGERSILNPPDGFPVDRVGLDVNPKEYLGGGGFKKGPTYRTTLSGIAAWSGYDFFSAPTTGGFLRRVQGCGLRLCTDPGAYYQPELYDGALGNYQSTWTMPSLNMHINVHHNTLGDTTTDQQPRLYQILVNDSAGNTNVISVTPTSTAAQRQLIVSDNQVTAPLISKSNVAAGTCTDVLSSAIGIEWGFCVGGASGYVAANGTIPSGGVGVVDKTTNKLLWASTDTLQTDTIPRALPTGSTMNGSEIPQTSTHTINKAVCYKSTTPIILGSCSTVVDATGGCTCI